MHRGMTDEYSTFLRSKVLKVQDSGMDVSLDALHPQLFPFQAASVQWALRKGRAALWQAVGLGKTWEQVAWASQITGTVLIVAPLAVAQQTVKMAREQMGVEIQYVRSAQDMIGDGIYATNYEMLHAFIDRHLDGIVLDESAILAHIESKTRQLILAQFRDVPYRLSCTATPCPNDIDELAGQAEFLGVMTRNEMLSTWFVHDDEGWRLRGHATEPFFRWLASWAQAINSPADIGFDGSDYILPPLEIREHVVETDWRRPGELYPGQLKGISDRADVRKQSVGDRVRLVAELANATGEQFLIWCGLNDEGTACVKAIPDAIEVHGAQPLDMKIERLMGFVDGKYRVLVTKGKIAGHGLNLQNAYRMIFMGLNDSWALFHQSIGRMYRYGQQHTVIVDIVVTDHEVGIVENVKRKARESQELVQGIIDAAKEYEQMELGTRATLTESYETADYEGDGWKILQGDFVDRGQEIPDRSVDLSVFSPAFGSLYQYSATERDLGNCQNLNVFFEHFGFMVKELTRITKPGRLACVHVADIPAMMVRDGYIGVKNFSDAVVKSFEEVGWIYNGRMTIDKNPQIAAIRTHVKALAFPQLKKDSSVMRPTLADYVLLFIAPGENTIPILPDIDNDTWIEWAHSCWYGIRETDTLSTYEAKSDEDDKHLCALQLGVIERCIQMWSNPGETVCDPFGGIGSTGYVALKHGRRSISTELKPLYARCAARNMQRAEQEMTQQLGLAFDA